MPESLLTNLKFLLLALLYLFFLRVLRAVWAEVHAPRTAAAAAGQPGPAPGRGGMRDRIPTATRAAGKLKVVESAKDKGRVFPLGEELTVGRAAGCQVRVDDTYASQLHARIFEREGQHYVEDLGSTNKTYINRKGTQNRELVAGPMALRPGDRLFVGKTVFEVTR